MSMADSQPKALLPAEEALERLLSRATPVAEVEQLETIHAGRRVLAHDVMSQLDVPPMDNTQMDGYALRASDVTAPGALLPVGQRIAAGHVGQALAPGTAARIFTGAMIPQGADTVVMQEQCTAEGGSVRIGHVPKVGEWVRPRGCDIRAGDVILQAGQRLRPQDLGLAASVGLKHLDVRRRLRVAVFFTGDELAMPGEPLKPGAIYNSNRFVIADQLQRLGCDLIDLGLVPDSLAATQAALAQAANQADVVITTGGVSVGEEDHIRPAVLSMGALDLWQLAIKPGKPLAFGHVRRAGESEPPAYFFGLPGNPVSSFVTFVVFVRPFLLRMQGVRDVSPHALLLPAAFDWPKADKRREYLRANITDNADIAIYSNQNSAVLSSVAWAGGLVDNPPGTTIAKGDRVRYIPFSELLD
jgi:molybdopterin molybdotransferase